MASISEAQRAKMFTSLSKQIGTEEAETLTTALNLDGQLATRDELRTEILVVRDELRTEILAVREDLRHELGVLRDEVRTGLDAVRLEMRTEFGAVQNELAAVRKEVGETRERFASANRALLFQLLAMQMSLFGLVIAGAKLLG
jgi:uncharacterized protein (DUF3084 family)